MERGVEIGVDREVEECGEGGGERGGVDAYTVRMIQIRVNKNKFNFQCLEVPAGLCVSQSRSSIRWTSKINKYEFKCQ